MEIVLGLKMIGLVETDDPRWRYRSGDEEHFPFKVWTKLRCLTSQQHKMTEALTKLVGERREYEAALAVWDKVGGDAWCP